MRDVGQSPMTAKARAVGTLVAAGLPFLCFIATASGYGHWLDSGEFVAVATDLGISHPPGHPAASLVLAVAGFLPLGPFAFRVALVCSLLGALAAASFFRAMDTTLRMVGVIWDAVSVPLAVGATWVFATSYASWFQAVRPEVYALQTALLLFALERVVAFEAASPSRDVRPFYVGCVAFGLALANHHFLAFLLLPAAMPTLARIVMQKGRRPLLLATVAVLPGLCTYVFHPLRARAAPYLALGDPRDLPNLLWVVQAKAFQKNAGDAVPEPWATRVADVGEQVILALHPLTFPLALLGAYVMLRHPATRRIGIFWSAVALVFLAGRVVLGFTRDNPDALGYLLLGFAAITALAASFLGMLLAMLGGARVRPPIAIIALSILFSAAGVYQIARSAPDASLATFTDTDAFDDGLRRTLPTRAVVLAFHPPTLFRFWGGEAEEHVRPDVTFVPMPLLSYPGMVPRLAAEHPELEGVLRGYLLHGELRQPDLQTLAASRPVLVEMDPRVPRALFETLAPDGLYHAVLADGATDGDVREGGTSQRRAWRHLAVLVPALRDRETRSEVFWRRSTNALFAAAVGDRDAARENVDAALVIHPQEHALRGLRQALDQAGRGPIDIAPYLDWGPDALP